MEVILKLSPENLDVIAEKVAFIQNKKKKEESNPPPNQERQYTVNEVAKMARVTVQTIYVHRREGLIIGTRVGRCWLFSETNYKKYINNEQ
ncbi:MAG: helix-turn-helix domain-containing protein [Flavobacterium sp.]|nr:helix-turn-helix domain-containing protein [Flavobacterium sp.]